mgnify:CR=1 FL=1
MNSKVIVRTIAIAAVALTVTSFGYVLVGARSSQDDGSLGAADPSQATVLEDGVVTWAEHEAAIRQTADCLANAGVRVELQPAAGCKPTGLGFSVANLEDGTSAEGVGCDAEDQRADEESGEGCAYERCESAQAEERGGPSREEAAAHEARADVAHEKQVVVLEGTAERQHQDETPDGSRRWQTIEPRMELRGSCAIVRPHRGGTARAGAPEPRAVPAVPSVRHRRPGACRDTSSSTFSRGVRGRRDSDRRPSRCVRP